AVLSALGQVYSSQGQWPQAEEAFRQALALAPADADALAGMAAVYEASGRSAALVGLLEAQLAKVRRAGASGAAIATVEDQLARAYLAAHQAPKAEAVLRQALGDNPGGFHTYVLLGTLYGQEHKLEQAAQQFAAAAAAEPSNPGLWTTEGLIDDLLHKRAAAATAYRKALALDPANGIANNNLAAIYTSESGKLQQALVLAQRAKRALPAVAEVNDTLGWVYVRQGLYPLAIPLLQQAVRGQPEVSDFHLHLGTALYGNGQKQAAQQQLRRAVAMDPALAQQSDVQKMLRG
ncbi:MAG: tetratricopeptide repeat protein, partial [Terriglobales bacterium]